MRLRREGRGRGEGGEKGGVRLRRVEEGRWRKERKRDRKRIEGKLGSVVESGCVQGRATVHIDIIQCHEQY